MKVVFRNLAHHTYDAYTFLRLIRQITLCSLDEARDYSIELERGICTELQWDGLRHIGYVEALVAELNENGDHAEIVYDASPSPT